MEEKQLNFNQPLLSVRRVSSTVTSQKDEKRKTGGSVRSIPPLPSYRTELKSGPLHNPGSVPFVWEHSPGRPKDHETSPQVDATERPPTVPKLPPGRISKPKKQDSDTVSDVTSVTKAPGKDPFGSQSVPSPEEKVTKFESSKETMEGSSDSGDGDEYMDALETLSRSESLLYNCSVTGLSGLDTDLKPSGTFSTDPKTWDFMMGRFLPAAKAMTSETPQYAMRKQPVVREQPQKVKNVVNGDKRPPLRYGPNFALDYARDNAEEESDDYYDEYGNTSFKVCGLIPRFCLKGSFGRLNPVPGMSVRTRVPMSPLSRTRASSSSAGSSSEAENEPARVAIYEQRSLGGLDRSILKNDSSQITNQNNFQGPEGSTLYKRLQGGHGMSTYHNELSQPSFSKQEEFLSYIPVEAKDAGFNGFSLHNEGPISFKELLADESNDREIDLASPMVEKTLYVDIVHKVESPKPNSCSSDMKGQSKLRENDIKILAKSKGLEETPSVHFSVNNIENLNVANDLAVLQSNTQIPADKSKQAMEMERLRGFGKDAKIYQNSNTSANTKVSENVKLDFEVHQPTLAENLKNSHGSFSESPVPPPLPKSPSDSWLWRTLPSMSSKNASLRSYLGTGVNRRNPASKTSSTDPKLEKNIQTTNAQHQNFGFSEGLLTPIPEN